MLEDDTRSVLFQDYSATCLAMIGRALIRDGWTLPPFTELVYPEQATPKDTRSAQEIIADLIKRL